MTICQSLIKAKEQLLQFSINNTHLEAEILLSNTLNKPREFILAHPDEKITKYQNNKLNNLINERLKGVPLAYLTGYKEFYGRKFIVNKHVLIPRPETELMVDEAIRLTQNKKHVTYIDVGTGSGCVIISLVKTLKEKKEPGSEVSEPGSFFSFLATDISKPALTVARKNAKRHGVENKIKFFHGNLLKPIIQNPEYLKHLNNPNNQTIITANLPYLTPRQIKNSPTIKYEPKLALSAGPDGLKYYHQLFEQLKRFIQFSIFNFQISILCEINPNQTIKIKRLIKKMLSNANILIKKDLTGRNRLVIIKINKNPA